MSVFVCYSWMTFFDDLGFSWEKNEFHWNHGMPRMELRKKWNAKSLKGNWLSFKNKILLVKSYIIHFRNIWNSTVVGDCISNDTYMSQIRND